MNELLQALFGFDSLRPGGEGVRFGMTRELPLWVWAPVVAGALALAAWSYWRLEGRLRGRVTLACARGLLLVLLALLAAGPSLIRDNERTERDTVVVLLDRSSSLQMPDGGAGATRDAQLAAVTGHPVWDDLAEQHDLLWLGFDAAAYEVDRQSLETPDGPRTRLGPALGSALSRLSGRPISGVVVVSDGRTSEEPGGPLLREFTAAKVGVFPVPLGSEQPLLDVAVESVDAPSSAFVGDYVPVTARLAMRGVAESGEATRVVLVDTLTGEELDSATVGDWADGRAEVRLATRPEEAGGARWAVRVEAGGADVLDGNNEKPVEVELLDRPLRVVYFEGYPRWEYRGVKDLLVREQSVRSSVMLLATDRRYIQEGNVALPNVPRSSGEWSEFDVVVIGDLRPDVFSREQLEQLRDHVAQRGGGLVWLAGPGSNPWSWADTPLGDLLPFASTLPGGLRGYGVGTAPITLRREAAADRLGVLEMSGGDAAGWLSDLSDPDAGWSVLRWSLAIEPRALKATASVLASGVPTAGSESESPVVMSMRYGAGRVVFVGTDEIWQWRYGRGEALPERFYLPLIRLAGRGSLARSGRSVLLDAQPGSVGVGTPVRIGAVLLDQSLVDAAPPVVEVRITRKGQAERAAATLRLGPEAGDGDTPNQTAEYAASWSPSEPGEYVVTAVDPLLASADARAEFRALAPDDELRTPEADHALLASLAATTGGEVIAPDEVARLPELLPNRSVVIAGEPEVEPLWDKPIVLAVLVLLLTAEWVGRRLLRLV